MIVGVLFMVVPLVVPLGLLAIAAAVDLVRRDAHVPAWWLVPLLPWTVMLPLLAIPLLDSGQSRWITLTWITAMLWMGAAGNLLGGSMALALARGLQPDGPTERRFRTTLVASLLLGAAPLGVVFCAVVVPEVLVFAWLIPAGWGGLIWVLLLNRRGPERLERGRRVAATWLAASGLVFVGAVAHFALALWMEEDIDWKVGAIVGATALGVVGMVGGLRVLAGPLQRKVLAASLISWATAMVPFLGWSLYRAVPDGTPLPTWVDLRGDAPELHAYRTHGGCVLILPTKTIWGSCDTWSRDTAPVAAPPNTPITEVPSMREILVGSGLKGVWYPGPSHGLANVDIDLDGVLRVDGVAYPDRAAAHDAIRRLPQVDLAYHPGVTLQDWVGICGSYGWLGACTLVEPPPQPLPTGQTDPLLKFFVDDLPVGVEDTDSP